MEPATDDLDIEYVPIDDVARKLHISLATVRGWVRRGHIPAATYIRVGNTYRFNMAAVVVALLHHEEHEEHEEDTVEENNLETNND
jgi:excisionase family DNA binding protein|tara:strand:- start:5111 stop:5368 length:258 start_codon:yes stop_codon:yes gene_type:complete